MPEINATAQDPEANSYLTLEDAGQEMDTYLHAGEWQELEEEQQQRILVVGTRLIDQYKAWGPKSDADQALSFPTKKDVNADGFVVPAEVKRALLEYCDFMAAGDLDHLKRLQAEGVTNASILGQSTTMTEDRSGLPAGARRELDKIWLGYNAPVVVKKPLFRGGDPDRTMFG